ncbi:MAG: PSD1 and planctomycete cytochrome C domain-containing protein [Planctomycetota bacterium]|nr:PSD1 and planctomycete cytochrome C domain-containing protein [Planctomycetota bacterium]
MRTLSSSAHSRQGAVTRAAILAAWLLFCFGAPLRAQEPQAKPATAKLEFKAIYATLHDSSCLACHNEKKRKGGLDLTTAASALKGGDSGPVIVPGQPDNSLMIKLISKGEMPPGKKWERVSPSGLKRLRDWIKDGARSREHPEGAPATQKVTEHEINPILLLRCTVCHGGRKKEAGLDLRTRESMLKGGKSGPAMIPGKPDESLMIKKIRAGAMPPARKLVEVSVKFMRPSELQLLELWIRAKAPAKAKEHPEQEPLVDEKERDFWSFQPLEKTRIPEPENKDRVRNPVDAFIETRLGKAGLRLAPDAGRLTLLRRACFDLLGLPPRPEDVEAWLADDKPGAWERLVDRLLESPRYGERWGRHWLDVAGYSDSEGGQHADRIRPQNWRYRDYVIQAFNDDKPYDQFLLEQLAGDELADYRSPEGVTDEVYSNLIATAFLRQSVDGTYANITNFVPDRLEIIDDVIETIGSSLLGLTLHCARCHSHKFDPIPQRDYYRLAATFKGALDEHDWLKPDGDAGSGRYLSVLPESKLAKWKAEKAAVDAQVDRLRKELAEQRKKRSSELGIAPGELDKKDADFKKTVDSTNERIKELEKKKPEKPLVRALWDRGTPSPTYLLKRGNYLTSGRPVSAGVLSALTERGKPFRPAPPWEGAASTGRRLAFARWLTSPKHPLAARVMVNRIWKHHFGRGIVSTLDNFGKTGARPTHPGLLDWLASRFIEDGWSIKKMHRLLMSSAAYRQSSVVSPLQEKNDPENRLFSRMPLARMEAEVVRDSILSIAGRLDLTPFGAADGVEKRGDGLVTSKTRTGKDSDGWRRSIYVLQRRTQRLTILDNFDLPQMNPNCTQRNESVVAPQALHLLNNKRIHQLASIFAARVLEEAGPEEEKQVRRAYLLAASRPPEKAELDSALAGLKALKKKWRAQEKEAEQGDASRRALENFCHALINSASFLYID